VNLSLGGREERKEIRLLEEILDQLTEIVALLTTTQSTTAVLTIEELGDTMANAVLTFTDASGAPIAPPTGDGSGLVVTFASDNAAVTVGPAVASGDTATAPITGTEAFNLSATVANASGAALLDNDGVTPFVQPSAIAVPASAPPPDQATTAVLSTS